MNRYVLRLDDITYAKSINWIIKVLPVIEKGSFEEVLILDEDYLNEAIGDNGYARVVTRKQLIESQYPSIQFIKIKIVLDE